ncbi:LppA family lipoprotein [Amycolatopsis dendrobii]|uniref:LppA family lipoprotein n=1 Tax=Amycolatopsis dendrobii TaxID=2760662 RepID=UPI0024834A7C|nr:LppA family lipoprotein [Amycolatopsis dendrobii]
MPLPSRSAARLATLALALALTSGCSQKPPYVPEGYAKMMKLPDIDQAKATYTAMVTAIRDRLTAEFGRTWEKGSEVNSYTCGIGYIGVGSDSLKLHLPMWKSSGSLAEADWPRAQALVGQLAAGYGFRPAPEANQPGNHTMGYTDPNGAMLHFGTGNFTVIEVTTGCHLTAEAHRRGGPTHD